MNRLKTLLLSLLVGAAAPLPAALANNPTAKSAMNAFAKQRGSGEAALVIGVVGFNGQDQPVQWIFLQKDLKVPKLLHEYVMRNGKIVAERRFWRDPEQDLPSAPISFSQVAIDSNKAFLLADQAAKKANLGFDSVNYQLRGRDLRNEPVWVLNMLDDAQRSIGIVYISAVTGEALRSVWNRPGPSITAAPPAPSPVPQTVQVQPKAKGLIPQLKQKRQAKKAASASAYAAPPASVQPIR